MSQRSDPNQEMTTQGAIEESRRSGVEQTATSGVVSGAGGPEPVGAPMPGMTGSGGQAGAGRRRESQTDRVLSEVSQQSSGMREQAGHVSDQASAKVEAGKEKAAGGLESLAGKVREKSETMGGGQMQSVASTAAEGMQAGAAMLRGEGGGSGEMTAKLESYVRSKPAESMAIAAGLGFIVAKVLK